MSSITRDCRRPQPPPPPLPAAIVHAPANGHARLLVPITMSQDPRPPKRARSAVSGEDAPEDAGISLKRSDEFWIEDGNIVLIAGETAFRVYRGLLALQSTVFADLFASSSPSAEERYDDCPVIRLTDSPQDLAHLLRALLPTSHASYV